MKRTQDVNVWFVESGVSDWGYGLMLDWGKQRSRSKRKERKEEWKEKDVTFKEGPRDRSTTLFFDALRDTVFAFCHFFLITHAHTRPVPV